MKQFFFYFNLKEHEIDGQTIIAMKEKDKELFFKNKLRLIVQFNSLVDKLQTSHPINSALQPIQFSPLQNSAPMHAFNNEILRPTITQANNNFTSVHQEPPLQPEPAPESVPKPFPIDFKFQKEKVGHVLSAFLEDPQSKHTDLLFTNTLIDIVFDQIISLNM